MPRSNWDAIVVGAGPAGSTFAATLARGGARVLVIEREKFPREKVCGDCLNPGCSAILDKLGVTQSLSGSDHAIARFVSFVAGAKERKRISLPTPEMVIPRSALDQILADKASESGAQIMFEATVERVGRTGSNWEIRAGGETFRSSNLVAADGRNSTVARLLGILPPGKRGRAAIQSHLPLVGEFEETIRLQILPFGYAGIAPIGGGRINVCLVSRPNNLDRMRHWADANLGSNTDTKWGSIAPLNRAPVPPAPAQFPGLFLLGDAARVVEPFTGEGIYYGLKTGELAAGAILSDQPETFANEHARLYRGRLWLNRLTRFAVTHPRFGRAIFGLGNAFPPVLRALTKKVTGPAPA